MHLSDKFKEQIFYQYGNLSSLPFTVDVVIHARNKQTGETLEIGVKRNGNS